MNLLKDFFDLLEGKGNSDRVCKTRMVDDSFFECKVKRPNPIYCEYSLRSGGGFICNHESREMFTTK